MKETIDKIIEFLKSKEGMIVAAVIIIILIILGLYFSGMLKL
jgi:hypothetical protein